jgi:hypothetical protein
VKDFHEEIRADTLARNVLSSVHKQQMIDELRKMQIVPKKEDSIVLSEEEFADIAMLAQKYTLIAQNSSAPMFSLERRKVISDLNQYATVVISQHESEKSLCVYCYKIMTLELGMT